MKQMFDSQLQMWRFEEGRYYEDSVKFLELFSLCQGLSLREKCPNTEVFLVRNFPYSD